MKIVNSITSFRMFRWLDTVFIQYLPLNLNAQRCWRMCTCSFAKGSGSRDWHTECRGILSGSYFVCELAETAVRLLYDEHGVKTVKHWLLNESLIGRFGNVSFPQSQVGKPREYSLKSHYSLCFAIPSEKLDCMCPNHSSKEKSTHRWSTAYRETVIRFINSWIPAGATKHE